MDKEEVIKKLRPVERLYLVSKENEDIYTKKNKVFCLLNYLVSNKNIKIKDSTSFKISFTGTENNNEYELKVLSYLEEKKYLALNKFIDESLIFNQTLIDLGIITNEVKSVKRLFINIAETKEVKSALYHELQGHFGREMDRCINDIEAICGDSYDGKTQVLYICLKNLVMKQHQDAIEKKKKDKLDAEKKKEQEKKKEKKNKKDDGSSVSDMIMDGF